MTIMDLIDGSLVVWSWFSFGVGVLGTCMIAAITCGAVTCWRPKEPAVEPQGAAGAPQEAPAEQLKMPSFGWPETITYDPAEYEQAMRCVECDFAHKADDTVLRVPLDDEGDEALVCTNCVIAGVRGRS